MMVILIPFIIVIHKCTTFYLQTLMLRMEKSNYKFILNHHMKKLK